MEVISFLLDSVGWFAWIFFLGALALGFVFACEQWGLSALRREHAALQERLLRLRWTAEHSRSGVPRSLPLLLPMREVEDDRDEDEEDRDERDPYEEHRIFAPRASQWPAARPPDRIIDAEMEEEPDEIILRSEMFRKPDQKPELEELDIEAQVLAPEPKPEAAPAAKTVPEPEPVPGVVAITPMPAPAPAVSRHTIRIPLPPAEEEEEDDHEPEHPEPLWMIRGVGQRGEKALNGMGVYRFVQIGAWSPDVVRRFQDQLQPSLPLARIERDRWVEQAAGLDNLFHALNGGRFLPETGVDHESVILTEFSGEDVVEDPALGIVFKERPALTDPLHRIDGIGPLKEELLHHAGIYRFLQIAHWSAGNLEAMAGKVGVTLDWMVDHHWIPQARLLQLQTYMASPEWGESPPSLADLEKKMRVDYAGEPVRADTALGILFRERPPLIDEFMQVRGLPRECAARLNEAGVWQYRQIADWSETQARAFARLLQIDRRRIYLQGWIPQARQFAVLSRKRAAFAGESIRLDQRLGILYYSPPDHPDPLTEIDGIDAETAQFLNRHGIHMFKQIAQWESDNLREFIRLSGMPRAKVLKARWPARAQELHQERYGFAA